MPSGAVCAPDVTVSAHFRNDRNQAYFILLSGQSTADLSLLAVSVQDVNEQRFLDRLARGDLRNVRFTELCQLVKVLGLKCSVHLS
ncbi:MAG TPA: hypothetical protein VJT72_05785 [Pseudonocardiaceae bacterium]|nr:hypothetical protein [Pseudonocardiaceae bacterium]